MYHHRTVGAEPFLFAVLGDNECTEGEADSRPPPGPRPGTATGTNSATAP